MGIVGSAVDPNFFESFLGMRVEFCDMSEFNRRINADLFDSEELIRAKEYVSTHFREGKDYNAPHQHALLSLIRMETSIKMLNRPYFVGNPAQSKRVGARKPWSSYRYGFQVKDNGRITCQTEIAEATNSSWDWNEREHLYFSRK